MKSKERRKSERLAIVLGSIVGSAFALVVAQIAPDAGWRVALPGFVIGGAIVAVPAVLYGKIMHRMVRNDRELRALANIRPLYGATPLVLDAWSMDGNFGDLLARTILGERPQTVVECGSGSSTVLIAACLRELGAGRVVSLEHEPRFAERTREALRRSGLEAWAEVVTAPLEPRPVDGIDYDWYGAGADAALPAGIDLLVVDGPPAGTGEDARYPAVPLLQRRLAANCTILMDDGRRPAETRAARRWAERLGGSPDFLDGGRGAWVIRCRVEA